MILRYGKNWGVMDASFARQKCEAFETKCFDRKLGVLTKNLIGTIKEKKSRFEERRATLVSELSADKKTARTFELSVPGGQ
jgi:hypothetical protein